MFHQFLSARDAERALLSFGKLVRHGIGSWALTGGFAIEIHHILRGFQPSVRPLNDLDFIAGSFDSIPRTLGDDFIFRHIHPLDPPGKTMLQSIDPESAVRIDVFRAFGATLRRTSPIAVATCSIRLISLEDLVARMARLALDLAEGVPVPAKYVRDYARLANLVNPAEVEEAWRDQRKPKHPSTFEETHALLSHLIPTHHRLPPAAEYSKDVEAICPRCDSGGVFRLAEAGVVLALLGYC